jgi:hypothetical protein
VRCKYSLLKASLHESMASLWQFLFIFILDLEFGKQDIRQRRETDKRIPSLKDTDKHLEEPLVLIKAGR